MIVEISSHFQFGRAIQYFILFFKAIDVETFSSFALEKLIYF